MEENNNTYTPSNQLFKNKEGEWGLEEGKANSILFADHLRTPENMGAIIRIADNLGIKKVFFIQDDPNFNVRENKIQKASGSSHHHLDYQFIQSREVDRHIPEGYLKVGIETTSDAKCIYETKLPHHCAFFVGNEKFGMKQEMINQMDFCVYIPIPGNTKSLNVSHSLSIALFEWYRQMKFTK